MFVRSLVAPAEKADDTCNNVDNLACVNMHACACLLLGLHVVRVFCRGAVNAFHDGAVVMNVCF